MNRRYFALLAAASLSIVACSHPQSAQSVQTPAAQTPLASPASAPDASRPAATAPSRTAPAKSPSYASRAVSSPAATPPTPPPTATPQPKPTVPRLSPNAPPRIVSVDVDKTTVGSGDTVSGTVLTSSNVASVEVRVASYGVTLSKVGVGRFTLAYTLGNLPFFVRGTYEMRIIARNARGDAAQQSLPITVR